MLDFLAHSPTFDTPDGHPLVEHLKKSADFAELFFHRVSMREFGALAGDVARHHDAGKYKTAFQQRLMGETAERVDHGTLGGQLLVRRYGEKIGRLLAFAVLGHHGAMPNGAAVGDGHRTLEDRLSDPVDEEAVSRFYKENPLPQPATLPRMPLCKSVGFEIAVLVRMLHSALVDADYLDTERYFEPQLFSARRSTPGLSRLYPRYKAYMETLERESPNPKSVVNQMRRLVRLDCEAAAALPKGFFTLTVPTGGGKTLASLGFALGHALAHPEIRRIVYAIPFTSIIEQNADVFAHALGRENVLEHHSSVNWSESPRYAQLAAENWDAPLIVTTNVQLFESLYAAKPSKCRKTHNLINAIIILDEAQALPDAMLKPCLQALCSLVRTYGATVVICTATQPDLSGVWPEQPEIREIINDVPALFSALKRTRTTMLGTLTDEALLSRVAAHEQALCIVNTRAHAQKLYRAMSGGMGVYHLSALMCPEHRTKKLNEIRGRLKRGERCIVFSTSLVEAGVDIDLPYVYRALAGLDSVAQAAGRCNRSGNLPRGEVFVFRPAEVKAPPDLKRLGAFLDEVEHLYPDLMDREAMDHYFRLRFASGGHQPDPLDDKGILARIEEHAGDGLFPFSQIAKDFEMIRSAGEPLFIPYDDRARDLIRQLHTGEDTGNTLRALQRYAVTVYPHQLKKLQGKGYACKVGDVNVLDAASRQMETLYTEDCGLNVDAEMATLFDFA